MEKTTRKFDRVAEHSNTVSFQEIAIPNTPPIVGKVYLQKWYAGDVKQISITVEPAKP